jgi:hypothetical protein
MKMKIFLCTCAVVGGMALIIGFGTAPIIMVAVIAAVFLIANISDSEL